MLLHGWFESSAFVGRSSLRSVRNPQRDVQAQDRAHRIGQENEVRVFRFVCRDSIEERMIERASHKLDIDKKVIHAGMFNQESTDRERTETLVREGTGWGSAG